MGHTRTIRSRSPVAGLQRAQLTFTQVLGQSVSAVAPSAVMVTLPALVLPAAGHSTIAVFVLTALMMTAVGYCITQFSTRMVAVSGLYSYTVKGLGPVPGVAAGWSLVVGYAAAARRARSARPATWRRCWAASGYRQANPSSPA